MPEPTARPEGDPADPADASTGAGSRWASSPARPKTFHAYVPSPSGDVPPSAELRAAHGGHGTSNGRASHHGNAKRLVVLPQAGLPVPALEVDARELEEALKRALEGDVRFDDAYRGAYAHDAS